MTLNESLHSLCFAFSSRVLSSMPAGEDVHDRAGFSARHVKGTRVMSFLHGADLGG